MGTRPASAPWLFPLLSLRSDRALAAPLTGSFPCPCPLPGPTAAALRPRGSALGGWQWPWSYLHLELAPGPVSVPAVSVAVTAGLDERLQPCPSPLDSWTHTEGQGREGEGARQRTGVTIPAPPDALAGPRTAELFSLGLLPWLQGWQCCAQGLCPQVPPGLPHSSMALLDSASIPHPPHSDPMGALGSCCSTWPSLPCPSPLCCRTGLSSITCDSLGRLSCVGLSGNTFVWFLCPCASESVDF